MVGVPFFLAAYAIGVLTTSWLEFTPVWLPVPFLAVLFWRLLFSRHLSVVPLLLFFFSLGFLLAHFQISIPKTPSHIVAFADGTPVRVEGEVNAIRPRWGGRTQIDLKSLKVFEGNRVADIQGNLRLTLEGPPPEFLPGDRLRFRSRLKQPRTFGTPGEFNYPRYLAARGIFVTAFVPRAEDLAVFPSSSPSILALIHSWREHIGQTIGSAVEEEERASLLRALLLGEKELISPQSRNRLARGGLSHLFSISGLHLGLIALFLYAIGNRLFRISAPLLLNCPPRRHLPVLLLPILFAYLLLSGFALSTSRAFLMILLSAAIFLGGRRTPPLKLLAAAAFLMLLNSPLSVYEAAFQLSFAGVAGMLILLPRWFPLVSSWPRPARWLATTALATLAATLSTTPFVVYHFHLLAPAGLLTNLFAIPLIGFLAVPAGLAGAALVPLCPSAAAMFFRFCGEVVEAVVRAADHLCQLPGIGGIQIYATPLEVIGMGLLLVTLLVNAKIRYKTFWRSGACLAGLALLILPTPSSSDLAVTVLSVGQGDAALLSFPDDRHFLIDGGGSFSDHFDTGERLVAPALGYLGVRHLEGVLLTHPHPDHWKGLVYILSAFKVDHFWSALAKEDLPEELRHILNQKKIPLHTLEAGWNPAPDRLKGNLSFFVPSKGRSLNNRSVVVHIPYGQESALLTGDLEAAGVMELLQEAPAPAATLLKIPHHGSRSSLPGPLMTRYETAWAFISAGAGNPYKFPHSDVLQEAEERGIPLFRTDTEGSFRFVTTGQGWQAMRWERGLFR